MSILEDALYFRPILDSIFKLCIFNKIEESWKVPSRHTTQKSRIQLTATLAVTANPRGVEAQASQGRAIHLAHLVMVEKLKPTGNVFKSFFLIICC